MLAHFSLMRIDINDIAHIHLGDIQLNGQGTGIFHGIKENGSNLGTQTQATILDIGNVRNFIAHEEKHRIGGGFPRRSRSHNISDVGEWISLGLQFLNLFERSNFTIHQRFNSISFILEHTHGMKWNIGTTPGILRGTQVIGIGFSRHFEHSHGILLGHLGFVDKPFRRGPGFQHGLCRLVALLGQGLDIIKGIKYQQCVFELVCRQHCNFFVRVVEQIHQCGDIVSTLHGS
mmetsp:Transcript_13718/g.24843  ORF Transcript_13718/g.24843 Transcript_13718/m.24843 type:complete len:232 (+) Transcript_13718:3057-3752(+)